MKTLFKNAVVLLGGGKYLKNGYVLTDGANISYVGENIPCEADCIDSTAVDCRGKMLAPALYNIHCHSAMTLFRGIEDDLPLQKWLMDKIYPAEDRLTPESVRIGSLLAAAEMIRGGVVSFSDMYFFCEETAKVVLESGMKANLSRCLLSFDENDSIKDNSRFAEAVALADEYHTSGEGRLKIDISVHAEYTNKAKFLREVADYTHSRGLNLQVHVSETELEHEECKSRNHGKTPTEFLIDNGILAANPKSSATAAHCVWVTERDIELLAENNVTVAHNPVSNLKLASGVAPVELMLSKGVRVGLGTDGAASNNSLSLMRELQTAALIHRVTNRRADVIPTPAYFDMASLNGAAAQGRNDCGAVKAGNRADLILIDLDEIGNIPMFNPYSTLAFTANSRDIVMTMCDGRILFENGEYKTLDVEKLRFEAKPILAHYFD